MTRTCSHLLGALCGLVLVAAASSAAAKPPRKAQHTAEAAPEAGQAHGRGKHGKRHAKADKATPAPESVAPSPEPKSERPDSRAEAQRRAAQDAALGADAQVVREGETQVKVMSFEGLDIEGRLKSPQLLYFVGRVHAEFDRPTLPHRSFMPELESSTHTAPVQ